MAAGILLRETAGDGPWNMAVDQVLLETAAEHPCVLRFYHWTVPTLSLGYFQPAGQRDRHPASASCSLVRRASGGGAILHHWELTYCLVVADPAAGTGKSRQLYRLVHAALAEALGQWGIRAQLRPPGPAEGADRFLCFQRLAEGDVLAGQGKIAGSAQRRSRQALMQHGSVLLRQSPYAPQLPGLTEVCGVELAEQELQQQWAKRLAGRLGVCWQPGQLSDAQCHRSQQLAAEKFGHPRWTLRR